MFPTARRFFPSVFGEVLRFAFSGNESPRGMLGNLKKRFEKTLRRTGRGRSYNLKIKENPSLI